MLGNIERKRFQFSSDRYGDIQCLTSRVTLGKLS